MYNIGHSCLYIPLILSCPLRIQWLDFPARENIKLEEFEKVSMNMICVNGKSIHSLGHYGYYCSNQIREHAVMFLSLSHIWAWMGKGEWGWGSPVHPLKIMFPTHKGAFWPSISCFLKK